VRVVLPIAVVLLAAATAQAHAPELGPEQSIAPQPLGRKVGTQRNVAFAPAPLAGATLAVYSDGALMGTFLGDDLEASAPFEIPIPRAAAAPGAEIGFDGESFVLVWPAAVGGHLWTMRLDQAGVPIDEPLRIEPTASADPRIACGDGTCAVVWNHTPGGVKAAMLAAGSASETISLGSGTCQDVAFGGADFVAVWVGDSTRILTNGAQADDWTLVPSACPAIGTNGTVTLTVWLDGGATLAGQRADGSQLLDAAALSIAPWPGMEEQLDVIAYQGGWLVLGVSSDGAIEALQIGADASAIGSPWTVVDASTDASRVRAVEAFLGWSSFRPVTDRDVLVATVPPPGRVADPHVLGGAPAPQLAPGIASRGDQALATWLQADESGVRLHASRVDAGAPQPAIDLGAWPPQSYPGESDWTALADGDTGVMIARRDGSIVRVGWDGDVADMAGPTFAAATEMVAGGPPGWLAAGSVFADFGGGYGPTFATTRVQLLDVAGVPASTEIELPETHVVGDRPVGAWVGDAWAVVTHSDQPLLWRFDEGGGLLAGSIALAGGEAGSIAAIVGGTRPALVAWWDRETEILRATRLDADGWPIDGEGVAHDEPASIQQLGVAWDGEAWIVVGSDDVGGFYARFDGGWIDPLVMLEGTGSIAIAPDGGLVATARMVEEAPSVFVRTFAEAAAGESSGSDGGGASESGGESSSASSESGGGGAVVVDRGCGCAAGGSARDVWWWSWVIACRRRGVRRGLGAVPTRRARAVPRRVDADIRGHRARSLDEFVRHADICEHRARRRRAIRAEVGGSEMQFRAARRRLGKRVKRTGVTRASRYEVV
jgi:hypothetical protein